MRRTTLAALLALLTLLAGCSTFLGGAPPSDERALDVRNSSAEAVDSTTTYRFATEMRVSASDGDRSRSVRVSVDGAVDGERRLMRAESRYDGESRATYVDGSTAYTECQEPWSGWGVETLDESAEWATNAPLGRQQVLLEGTEVYWRGNETLDGERTAVVVAHPSPETLAELNAPGNGATDVDTSNVENVTLTAWVDRESGRPVQSQLRIEIEAGGATGVARSTTTFEDYGEPVNVTVPASARTDQYEMGCPGE